MSNQRAPMSEEKKKAAAEKRKATIEANKKKQEDERLARARKERIEAFYEHAVAGHGRRMDDFAERQRKLIEERQAEEEWHEKQKQYHAKYCAAMINAGLPDEMFKAIMFDKHNGRVGVNTVHTIHRYDQVSKLKAEYTEKLLAIDGISNVSLDERDLYGSTYFRVSFDVAL